eukprot:CAMPEP_0119010050 /NCGR_PEP_ID=MMETSP1176-20130426/4758_1 /TAXON_ID=265551 /ORGANISM="Synedropsis recta cf, Strain CCMP1620" /LENGTH=514 /DNA_ID=CAMNT_0006962645 /DNA_START=57 /DNA_END=1601 /DNA_ORIENTATION=-
MMVVMTTTAVCAAPQAASADEKQQRLLKNGRDKIKDDDSSDDDDDPDFAYPNDMPRPPMMWIEGFASRLHGGPIQRYETPIQVWQTWRLDQCMWNCIATYHPTALDALTKMRPKNVAPPKYHTSEARALCMIHAVHKLIPDLVPIASLDISMWLAELGLDTSIMSNDEARYLADLGAYSPHILGSVVAADILDNMKEDGWNSDGSVAAGGKECTANCRPFTDTTGFEPINSPWDLTDPESWQPLIESDDLGFFHSQEHVTAHIGTRAVPVILDAEEVAARVIPDPAYDYAQETRDAIDRVANLDAFQRSMVKFMDNKINIAGGMITMLRAKYNLSLEAQVFYHYGYTSTELDVVILSWKEKIRWNRVRPTSLVQALGDEQVESFAGSHAARDWVPYIRVMPHAEYPSGSACICLGVAEFIDEFLLDVYGDVSISTTWEGVFTEIDKHTFADMNELKTICGESRLWGGMHFGASVDKGYDLCEGVGKLGYSQLMLGLLGVGDYYELIDDDKEKFM